MGMLQSGGDGASLEKFPPTICATLQVVEEFYRLSIAEGDASEATIRIYLHGAEQFMLWAVDCGLHPKKITYQNILEYRRFLLETLKPATVSLRIASLRRFYDGLVRSGLAASNPVDGVKVKMPRDQDSVVGKSLSLDELQRLLDGLPRGKNFRDMRDRAMVTVVALCGLREVEVTNLYLSDVERKGEVTWLRLLGKGGARRRIPLREDVLAVLGRYLAIRGDVLGGLFCKSPANTKALVERSVRAVITRELRAVGLGGYRPHDLRHSCASLSLACGASVEQVQRLLGHASISTTSAYLHALDFSKNNPSQQIDVKILD